jgi:capsular polysaccharide biosynthesis protein|tara:strand:- start:470 stop:694 length:225 start_codon:yes stop_codon:yes gene_type:complete
MSEQHTRIIEITVQIQTKFVQALVANDFTEFQAVTQLSISYFDKETTSLLLDTLRLIISPKLAMRLVEFLSRRA